MRENQGGFGVTDEGDLVSQMRGLPFVCCFCGTSGAVILSIICF